MDRLEIFRATDPGHGIAFSYLNTSSLVKLSTKLDASSL